MCSKLHFRITYPMTKFNWCGQFSGMMRCFCTWIMILHYNNGIFSGIAGVTGAWLKLLTIALVFIIIHQCGAIRLDRMPSIQLLWQIKPTLLWLIGIEFKGSSIVKENWNAYVCVELNDERWTHTVSAYDELLLLHIIVVDRLIRVHIQL